MNKLGFIGEFVCHFLSLSRESGAKSATQGRYPRYLPWESIRLICAPFRRGEKALCAGKSQFDGWPRWSAECRPPWFAVQSRGTPTKSRPPSPRRENFRGGRCSTDTSAVWVSCDRPARSTPFAEGQKVCANQEDSFLRKKPWVSSLSGASFGSFLSPRRERNIRKQTDKPKFESFTIG